MNSKNHTYIDKSCTEYRKNRIEHWNRTSIKKAKPKRIGAFYQKLLIKYYRFLIPEHLRILEIGCGQGDLLASLNPRFGVGVDFSIQMVREAKKGHPGLHFLCGDASDVALTEPFDVVIFSDLIRGKF